VFINIGLGWTEDRTDANISAEQPNYPLNKKPEPSYHWQPRVKLVESARGLFKYIQGGPKK